jgi:hypothetical protein
MQQKVCLKAVDVVANVVERHEPSHPEMVGLKTR